MCFSDEKIACRTINNYYWATDQPASQLPIFSHPILESSEPQRQKYLVDNRLKTALIVNDNRYLLHVLGESSADWRWIEWG